MKIALCSAVWGRVPLTRVWWKGVDRIAETFAAAGVEARAFVGGSESAHYKMCQDSNCGTWVEAANGRLGEKWNAVARAALDWGADYLFMLGSDDFFDDRLIWNYPALMEAGCVYAGLKAMYMHEPASGRTIHLWTDRKLTATPLTEVRSDAVQIILLGDSLPPKRTVTMGAGRLLHRSLFADRLEFWDPHKTSGLDASMAKNLDLPEPVIIPADAGLAVDVKTSENIWTLDSLTDWYPDSEVDAMHILAGLPEWDDICTLATTQPGE